MLDPEKVAASVLPPRRCSCIMAEEHGHEDGRCARMLVWEDRDVTWMATYLDPDGGTGRDNCRIVCRECLEQEDRWPENMT